MKTYDQFAVLIKTLLIISLWIPIKLVAAQNYVFEGEKFEKKRTVTKSQQTIIKYFKPGKNENNWQKQLVVRKYTDNTLNKVVTGLEKQLQNIQAKYSKKGKFE